MCSISITLADVFFPDNTTFSAGDDVTALLREENGVTGYALLGPDEGNYWEEVTARAVEPLDELGGECLVTLTFPDRECARDWFDQTWMGAEAHLSPEEWEVRWEEACARAA